MANPKLEIEISARIDRLQSDFDKVYRMSSDTARRIDSTFGAVGGSFRSALTGMAGLVSVNMFSGMVKGALEAQDHLNDLSKSTSISVETLAGLGSASRKSGADLDSVAAAVNKLSVSMGKDPEKFAAIGVSAKEPIEAFKQLADVFVAIKDPQERAAFGAAVLGKSWAGTAPLLSEGGNAIGEMVSKGTQLSKITTESAQAADELNDRLEDLNTSAEGIKTSFVKLIVPALNDVAQAMQDTVDQVGDLDKAANGVGKNNAIVEFADNAAVAMAIVTESVVAVVKAIRAIGGSFEAVWADVSVAGTFVKNGGATGMLFEENRKQLSDALDARNKTLADANKRYEDLWNYDGAALSNNLSNRIKFRDVIAAGNEIKDSWLPAQPAKNVAPSQKGIRNFLGGEGKSDAIRASVLAFDLSAIKSNNAELIDAYSNAEKIMQGIRSAGLMEEKDYYESKSAFIRLNAQTEESGLQQQLDRLRKEQLTGKEKIDNDKAIIDIEAKLGKVRESAAANLVLNSIEQEGANKKIEQSFDDARSAAESYLDTIQRQNGRTLAGMGMGEQFRTDQSAQNQIEDKFIVRRSQLDDDLRRKQITQETYDSYLAIATDTFDREVTMHNETRDAILAKQGDWVTGMSDALHNYSDEARDVAKQTEGLFTDAFKGMEDALVTFATTGKADFSSLAQSIIADMARMQIKAAMAPITEGIGGWLSGLFGAGSTADTSGIGTAMSLMNSLHTGGIVGGSEGSGMRSVSPSVFNNAPRFHTGGIVGGEVPIIAKRGEGVFTPGQMAAMGGSNVQVNIIESPGSEKAGTTQTRDDGGKTIIDVFVEKIKAAIAKDIGAGGSVASAMESQYGLNRAAGAWR